MSLPRRVYDDACGLAHALELLGERWTLLVVRELMLGGRRFSALRSALPGLSANVLTQRLASLEAHGVLRRRMLPPPARVQIYELTEWGYEAGPVIEALGRWAARSPAHDPTLPISAVSTLLSFRTMFRRGAVGDAPFTVGFRMGEEGWLGEAGAEAFHVGRGDPDGADICFTGEPEALVAFVYGGAPLPGLAEAGSLSLRGDPTLAMRFADLFRLPPKFDPGA
ncbi:winged helix-turn-helix transcriptional regulator [Camelimonas fluminis]|uniref:Winged helix-turn-helix transcriptional regulator n=1 Tax=Camelimonas fluminis TaxID=1576911 RepID=A0ABV7UG36_9HYPH|nr:winged helix-turn-helix transcriptional regulator [Camelimonas fluminis]